MVYILDSRVDSGFDNRFWAHSIYLWHCSGVGFRKKSSCIIHLRTRPNCPFHDYALMEIWVTQRMHTSEEAIKHSG